MKLTCKSRGAQGDIQTAYEREIEEPVQTRADFTPVALMNMARCLRKPVDKFSHRSTSMRQKEATVKLLSVRPYSGIDTIK